MATRKSGSGTATMTADLCADLFVALARRDDPCIATAVAALDDEYRRGHSGLTGLEVKDLLMQAHAQWLFASAPATAGKRLIGGLGDLQLDRADLPRQYVEVKAQTTKHTFADITQADWVRNETAFVFRQLNSHPHFTNIGLGAAPKRARPKGALSDAALWAADAALLPSKEKREEAGISSPTDLLAFLEHKWLLHVIRGRARLIQFSQIPAIRAALLNDVIAVRVTYNPQKPESPRVGIGKVVIHDNGAPLFTYHLYRDGEELVGRHKMHARVLEHAPAIEV